MPRKAPSQLLNGMTLLRAYMSGVISPAETNDLLPQVDIGTFFREVVLQMTIDRGLSLPSAVRVDLDLSLHSTADRPRRAARRPDDDLGALWIDEGNPVG